MITSTANSRVKRICTFQEKSRERAKEKVFVAEGGKMFEEAPLQRIREVYLEETLCKQLEAEQEQQDLKQLVKRSAEQGPQESQDLRQLAKRAAEPAGEQALSRRMAEKLKACREKGVPVETVSREVFARMSDTKSPQGILCLMEQSVSAPRELIDRSVKRRAQGGRAPLFLVLEDIQDPGNLGTMLRTAEGAGADGVFMSRNTVDIYNPKTIRATMGSLYRVPFCYGESLSEMISLLKEAGIGVYAAHLKGTLFYHQMAYREGAAFLIGNEGKGLKKETADLADHYLKIPMAGQLESLNAAVAAALLLYQAANSMSQQD